jgi:hypothetical protein
VVAVGSGTDGSAAGALGRAVNDGAAGGGAAFVVPPPHAALAIAASAPVTARTIRDVVGIGSPFSSRCCAWMDA